MVSQAPYGTWISPIAAEIAASDSITIEEILVDPVSSRVYHLEKRPSQGRNVLVDTENNCDIFGLGWNARSGVHEYGGAAATVHDGVTYFSHWADGRVYRVKGKESPEAITPENANYRYANFEVHPVHTHLLVAVLEDHTVPDPRNVVNCVCLINTLSGSVDNLVAGADFYAGLKFSPDGTHMTWKQWFHPQMPWDGSELHIGEIAFVIVSEQPAHSLTCENVVHIAGNEQTSVSFPSWANNDVLVFTSNESGYLNPWKYVLSSCKASPVLHAPYPFDFGSASALGDSPYAFTDPSGTGAMFSVFISGRSSLFYVSIESGAPPLELTSRKQYAVIQNIRQLHAQPSSIVFLGKLTHRPPRIVVCSVNISSGEQPLHIVFFLPTNAQYSGSSVPYERPPSIVSIHGGPTKMASQDFDWTKQFFTSRGWAWIDVNYRGSSGYGRDYINQLKGNWGITDVQDAIFAAKALSRAPYSLIDPDRIVIRGASAGGFTALASLSDSTNATFFAAGTSLYGISDFRKLAQLSHKYELMYLDGLLGGKPEEIPQVYADRSPISHADNIVQPLLIMQGSIDKVVPKLQSDMIVESIERRGGHVQYKLFEGEGHGFRKAENIRDALETELGFYAKVLAIPIKQ
ncbi:alpha/beta-hydrolase [Athelia psychrophila]|uniref:Alpha/beta-hydrolase n=1 Tax=Athelia psychrophila TaxID=1759441 RepID=A0A166LEV3_9AGAM|nr:alpha/beta-hydrolase [Fibularhizoctonia sp. CBS 109695]